jgi:ankyrin repeat protein
MDNVQTFWPNSFSTFQKPVPWDEVRAGIKEGGIFGCKEGYNLLHAFVQARNKPAVEFLLYKGNRLRYAFLHAKTKSEGLTPLHLAAQYPDAEIFELLLINGADSLATDKNGVSPWAMAIKAGNEELVNLLIAVVPENLNHLISTGTGRPLKPIAYAIECHNKSLVNLLLDREAEIEGMDGAGNTPLMTALQVKDLEIATILINKGADILATNERNETPLVIAVKTGSDEIFNFILEKQPEIETKTVDNETALLIATRMGKLTMVKALLEKGADPMSDYEPGASPLDVARAAKHTGIMKLLYDARATRKTGTRQRNQYDDELDRKVKAELAKEKKDQLKVDRVGDFNYKLSKGGLRYGSK